MIKLIILTSFVLAALPKNAIAGESCKCFLARVTYYVPGPKWGRQTSSGINAKQGITIAAHSDFKFGTNVYIPALDGVIGDGKFVVRDRGSAVQSKKAAKGRGYVFDVFVKNRSILKKMARKNKMWMKVYVE